MSDDSENPSGKPDRPLSALGLGIVGGVLILDQATKAWAERSLEYGQQVDLLPILSLYRVHNTGIAFSLLDNFAGAGLIALTLAIIVFVLVIWQRSSEGGRPAAIAYALIVGGALGNLVDRFAYGHVVDFLFLHLGDWPLFVFNIADAALTVGPIFMVLILLLPAGRCSKRP